MHKFSSFLRQSRYNRTDLFYIIFRIQYDRITDYIRQRIKEGFLYSLIKLLYKDFGDFTLYSNPSSTALLVFANSIRNLVVSNSVDK